MKGLTRYIDEIESMLGRVERGMELISIAADAAAERVVSGGALYGSSDEEGFISELSSRAGGLTMAKKLPEETAVTPGDVVLAATQDRDPDGQRKKLRECLDAGALVILIGSGDSNLRTVCTIFIDTGLPSGTAPVVPFRGGRICPLAGATHITFLWVFCAELASACIRRGRVPVFFQTGGLKAGADRNGSVRALSFHPDGEFTIPPLPAGELGRVYLAELHRCFGGLRATEMGGIAGAGKAAARAIGAGHTVWCDSIGHHLPAQKGIEGDPGLFTLGFPERKEPSGPLEPGDLYIFNGYFIFPEKELAAAREAEVDSVWIMGGKDVESIYPKKGEIHIDAYWRYGDAAVRIPGYDIKVLPASGVVTTAMLWMLHAAAADALKRST